MTLKAFWEQVEQRLAACFAEELRAIVRNMAQQTPPTERLPFLAKLNPPAEATATIQQALRQEELLADNELPRSKLRGILNGKERSKLRGI